MGILTGEEGDPVALENAAAQGRVILVCEHASRSLPKALGTLGLSDEALASHIAWDPGALGVARLMALQLDAALVFQRFSRLAYDCNRPPESPAAMPEKSEIFEVPGNAGLDQAARDARTEALYLPFRDSLSRLVKSRIAADRAPVIVTIHTFTPVYFGKPRAVEIGIVHDSDSRLADAMLAAAGRTPGGYDIRRNEPYGPEDGVTHTLKEHGLANAIANVMVEVRNDLVREEAGQRAVAGYLADLLVEGLTSPQVR
ncbi:putative N-formylglutamate amidohydrolase [Mycoplana dimorpha]|uniref:Putative N-formylglutamate amidohydrolase n=1 Tax=Mycoplana dimorpha TaxID=28320 RepID=A0A2T5AZD7_MYCDI|nr:putative N-formylglutamate amidohydrolase [Mycoplana dimorpha]